MVTKPSQPRLLADQAFECLRELLRTAGLREGQFVSISDLVTLTGFPLAPTREAVQKAAALGLVSIVPKRGVLILEGDDEIARQCLDLRCMFDQEGARRLCRQHDRERIVQLMEVHRQIIQEAQDKDVTTALQRRAMITDWDMHALLAEGLNNDAALALYTNNRDKLTIMYNSRPLLPDRLVPAFNEHLLILQAILDHNESAAVQAIAEHYRQIHRWWGILDD